MVGAARKRSWRTANVCALGNGVVAVHHGGLDPTARGAPTVSPRLELALATNEGTLSAFAASVTLDVPIHARVANVGSGVVARDVVRATVFDAALWATAGNRRPLSGSAKGGLGWVEARGKVVGFARCAGLRFLAACGERRRDEDVRECASEGRPVGHFSLSERKTAHRKNRVACGPLWSHTPCP